MPIDDNIEESRPDIQPNPETMRVAIGTYKPVTDSLLRSASQLGIEDILLTPHRHDGFNSALPLEEAWSIQQLTELRKKINTAGLRLYAIEKMPIPLYEILLNDDEREEMIEVVKDTIRNMGKANIPVLGYSGHLPDGAVRTSQDYPTRGGAKSSAFNKENLEIDKKYDDICEEDLWDSYTYFLNEVVPVAENADVKLGLHPSDPPVEEICGVPLLFRNFDNFKRALEIYPSDYHGLKLCLGCWSAMGEDISEVIQSFNDKIIYVHFRDVVGTVPNFHETFIDDPDGNFDEYEVITQLYKSGFTGVMTPDHVPMLEGETDGDFGSIIGRTYTIGYLKGMLKSLNVDQT